MDILCPVGGAELLFFLESYIILLCSSQITVKFRKWTSDIKFRQINKFATEIPKGFRKQIIVLNARVREQYHGPLAI